jgi:hypothetical protein
MLDENLVLNPIVIADSIKDPACDVVVKAKQAFIITLQITKENHGVTTVSTDEVVLASLLGLGINGKPVTKWPEFEIGDRLTIF